jgi:hypothetical protein
MKTNKYVRLWLKNFKIYSPKANQTSMAQLDMNKFKFLRYFMRNNDALKALRDPDLRELLPPGMCEKTFKLRYLPEIMDSLHDEIESKLRSAISITIISDIWSSPSMVDFLAVCAYLIDKTLRSEVVTIGKEVFKF